MSSDRSSEFYGMFAKTPESDAEVQAREAREAQRAQRAAEGAAATPADAHAATEPLPQAAQPAIWCSDCRAISRTSYYSVNDRAVCQKCRTGYVAKVRYGTGSEALRRVLLRGGGTALGAAVALGLALMLIGPVRIFGSLAVGYLVGTSITKATNSYLMRRYQILAVVLTYFAVGFGALLPVFKGVYDVRAYMKATPTASVERAGQVAADEEPASESAGDLDVLVDSLLTAQETQRTQARMPGDENSRQLAAADFVSFVAGVFGMLLILPLLGSFAYGLHAGVLGIFALVWSMRKAWEITSNAVAYDISGPYRVGTGPIKVTI